MAKVSVIIPVYNVEQYIEQCAISLFEQTLSDIEYIFVDDCSPDNSIQVLNRILTRYPNRQPQVIIHKMEKNSGQAAVRRWGMEHATGDYVIHCDSDDWIELNAYELLYNKAKESKTDIVFFDFFKSDGINHTILKRLRKESYEKEEMLDLLLCGKVTGSLCGALFQRNLYLENFEYPQADMGEDWTMVIQMVCNCRTAISYLSTPLYYYRFNPSSISESVSKESILKRYSDNVENGLMIYKKFDTINQTGNHLNSIVCSKLIIRKNLLLLLGETITYHQWFKSFPEINCCVFNNSKISLKDKAIFFLCVLRVYHVIKRRV